MVKQKIILAGNYEPTYESAALLYDPRKHSHEIETIRVGVIMAELHGITESQRIAFYGVINEAQRNVIRDIDAIAWQEVNRLRARLEALTPKGKQNRKTHDITDMRANCFKRLKDAHPEWTYNQVAQRASQELTDPTITEHTVRNVYRAKGWKWQNPRAIGVNR